MKGKRLGYCNSFVGRKWLSADTIRKKGLDSFLKRLGKSEVDMKKIEKKIELPLEYDDDNGNIEENDDEYVGIDEGNSKKRKRTFFWEAVLKMLKVFLTVTAISAGVLEVSGQSITLLLTEVHLRASHVQGACLRVHHHYRQRAVKFELEEV